MDTVVSVHVFPREMFDREKWIGKVHELDYPTVVGLDARFIASRDNADRGAAVITVPQQTESERYFLVSKEFVAEDGAPGWLIGISVRSADRNRPLGIGEIHRLISQSLNLAALHSPGYEFPYNRHSAPADSRFWAIEVDAAQEKPHIQPGRVAYDLIEQLYNWFGMKSDAIPYTSAEAREIDPATF